MTAATLLAVVTLLAGAAVQSGLGFGFAIVAAPVLAAADGPATAAPTLAVCGLATSSLVLFAERREREVLTGSASRLVLWALPGMAVGAVVLARVPTRPLGVLVAVAVLGAVALQLRGSRAGAAERSAGRPARRGGTGAVAGFVSGVLQTSVGLNGPAAVLHLLRRGATAGELRDTLAVVFLSMNVLSLFAFAATGTLRLASAPIALVVASVAGWALGWSLVPLVRAHHRPVSLAVLAFGATVACVQAVL